MRLRPVLWGVLASCLAMLLIGGPAARAADISGWPGLADTVFRPVTPGRGAAPVLLPEALAEDSAGFLWEGSQSGLARWDGYQFQLYTADSPRPDGLLDHYVQALHRAMNGRLWVGTQAGGLAYYDEAADRFVTVRLSDGHAPVRKIGSIIDNGHGGLWVGTGAGLFELDSAGNVLQRLHHDPADPGSLPSDNVEAVLRDRHGAVWIGGETGVARAIDGTARFVPVSLPVPGNEPTEVTRLAEDAQGCIWVGSTSKGAFVIAPNGGVSQVETTGPAPGETAATEITSILAVGPSHVWLGTFGQGIVEVDTKTLHTRRITHDAFASGSLDKDSVTALYRDRSGLIWVGTSIGLSQHDPGNHGILSLSGNAGHRNGLRLEDVSAVLARADGTLWVGSGDNGLQLLDPQGHYHDVLSVDRVYSIVGAKEGAVFVGSRSGLYALNSDGRALTRLDIPHRAASTMVTSLLLLGDTLWMGGDDGVWELKTQGAGTVSVVHHYAPAALTDGSVLAITLMPDGRLALGTNNGIDFLDRVTGAIERVFPDKSRQSALSPGNIYCFALDNRGRLWVGTASGGINVMTGRTASGDPVFRHIGRSEGMPNADVSRILIDGQGRIWASTDNGLAVIDPESFAVRALGAPDGVAITTYWNNSGDVTPQGDLVFGGVGGITIVRQAQVVPWNYRPPVVVTSVKIGGQVVSPGIAGEDADKKVMLVPPTANSLSAEFAALDYSSPEDNRYAYRLDGFDPDWIETDAAHRVASYTNLPPGSYKLHLRGSNREGAWTGHDVVLSLEVLPAWFETLWFRLGESAVAVLAVLGLVQGRTMILRRRQRGLERQVAERTAELMVSQKKLEHFAYFDTLTALPNRRAFNQQFQSLIDATPPDPFALVLVDLDGFKQVNDSMGHLTGDALLVAAADRMRHAVRECDFIARLGGDEFAILVRTVDARSDVDPLCERLVASMTAPFSIRGMPVKIGASMGAALFPQHGLTQDALYRRVDLALYEAKRTGRGIWCWYSETMAMSGSHDD
jgi:diguanylate cyclase (GGDEF)-like protein